MKNKLTTKKIKEIVDNFYSLPPRYRTKVRLIKEIEDNLKTL